MILYSIYDKVADEFGPFYEAKNDMVASRAYAGLVKPEMVHDYELYAVGERVDPLDRLAGAPDLSPLLKSYEFPRKIDAVVKFSADKKLALVEVSHE